MARVKKYQNGGIGDPTDPKKSGTASDTLNVAALKSGIAQIESGGGQEIFMINPDPNSTATGLYGQRFSEIDGEYEGGRTQFSTDLQAQEEYMNRRIEEGINAPSLRRNAIDLTTEYKDQLGNNWDFTLNEVAALSHFLGRGGARKYFASIRDGEDYVVSGTNKTPEEYLKIFREGESKVKNYGGYVRPIKKGDNGVTVDYETEDEEKNGREGEDEISTRDKSDYMDVLSTLGGLLKEYISGEGIGYGKIGDDDPRRIIQQPGNPISNIARHTKGVLSEGLNKYIQENIRPADYPDTKKLLTELLFSDSEGKIPYNWKSNPGKLWDVDGNLNTGELPEVDRDDPLGSDNSARGFLSDEPIWTDSEGDPNIDEEAYAMALGRPIKNKHFQVSEHTPSIGHEEGDIYYKSQAFDWTHLLRRMKDSPLGTKQRIYNAKFNEEALGGKGQDPYQNFTAHVGEDEKGTFISYYDKYDFASPALNNIIETGGGQKIQFYDKKYVKRSPDGTLSFIDSVEEDPTLRGERLRKAGGIVRPIKRGDNGITTGEETEDPKDDDEYSVSNEDIYDYLSSKNVNLKGREIATTRIMPGRGEYFHHADAPGKKHDTVLGVKMGKRAEGKGEGFRKHDLMIHSSRAGDEDVRIEEDIHSIQPQIGTLIKGMGGIKRKLARMLKKQDFAFDEGTGGEKFQSLSDQEKSDLYKENVVNKNYALKGSGSSKEFEAKLISDKMQMINQGVIDPGSKVTKGDLQAIQQWYKNQKASAGFLNPLFKNIDDSPKYTKLILQALNKA